jgi:ABC-type transport system substrate-binding protein
MRALATCILALSAACGDGGSPAGGVLVFGVGNPWQRALERPLGPSLGAGVIDFTRGRLVHRDDVTRLQLAESIVPGPDGRSWTVTIDRLARFSSGRPVTSADVVASIRAQISDEILVQRAVDQRQVRLELADSRTDLLPLLARVGIARADQADDGGSGSIAFEELDASGSWMVARVREPDVVLVRNPHAPEPERQVALAAVRGLTRFDPPAVFVFEFADVNAVHERFESSVPGPGQRASYLPGIFLLPKRALPRDHIEHWLAD